VGKYGPTESLAVVFRGFLDKGVDLRGSFDAGISASRDHKGQHLALHIRVFFDFCSLQHADDMVAKGECISQGLERKSVLCYAGKGRQVCAAAHGDDQLVVGDVMIVWVSGVTDGHILAIYVYAFNFSLKKIGRGN